MSASKPTGGEDLPRYNHTAIPRRNVLRQQPKPLITTSLVVAVIFVLGIIGLVLVAALKYKPPKSDSPNPNTPATPTQPSTPGNPPPPPPGNPDPAPGTTNPPKPPPEKPLPPPPVGFEWVGKEVTIRTAYNTKAKLQTSWYGDKGVYNSIQIDIQLIEAVKGFTAFKKNDAEYIMEIPLWDTPAELQAILYDGYPSGIFVSASGTDPIYSSLAKSWTLTPDARRATPSGKNGPNGKPIMIAPPSIIGFFSPGHIPSSIPSGTFRYIMPNIFGRSN